MEERDDRAVAHVGRHEAVEVTGRGRLRELVEQLGDVLLLVRDEAPLRLALVEESRQLLHDVDDRHRDARALHRLHVVGELLHGGERRHVLHAVFLAGVGDDDELVGAHELLVQLGVGDVVRVVREEQRRARRHVAHLEPPAEERTDEEERDREQHAGPAPPAVARRDRPVGELLCRSPRASDRARTPTASMSAVLIQPMSAMRELDGVAEEEQRRRRRAPRTRAPSPSADTCSSTPGGVVADRMIGCSVTTLMKIETIQKLEKMAHFWMSGIGAIATTSSADAVGQHRRDRRREQVRVRLDDRRVLVVGAVVLLVVAVHRLHRVRQGACREEDRDHEHERVEVQPEQRHQTERPDARQDARRRSAPRRPARCGSSSRAGR